MNPRIWVTSAAIGLTACVRGPSDAPEPPGAAETGSLGDTASSSSGTDETTDTDVPADTDATADTGATTDTGSTADSGTVPFPNCPSFRNAARVGTTPLFVVTEASGVAASRRNSDVLWLHNDSGAGPQVHAITPSLAGGLLGSFTLAGADAQDWEDIAIGPGPVAGDAYLYLADIGDNGQSRSTVQVYRVAEPSVNASGGPFQGRTLTGVERIELVYPDQPHDAETMMVDPLTGDLYVVVKHPGGDSLVFRARAPLAVSGTTTLERVTTLRFGTAPLTGSPLATAGDMSAAGDEIAIRTYDSAYLWRRSAGMTVDDAFATDPCPIPQAAEGQGEALGFSATGDGYYTVGEGSATWVNAYQRL